MTYLATQPQLLVETAATVAGIRSAIAEANAAARLFGAYAQQWHAVIGEAMAFHEKFVQALAAAGSAYAAAEAANAAAVASVLGGGPAIGAPLAATYDVALIMSGSGTPIPSVEWMAGVLPYIAANSPVTGASLPLDTPEGFYPVTGIKDLLANVSVARGVEVLDLALFGPQGLITAQGQSVGVLGYSQSSIISSLEMRHLAALGSPNTDKLSFTLLANPMNPNGGLLARFPGLSMPALGMEFYGATPSNTGYPLSSYTLQYDGFADFPRYPLNVLSVLNAMAGIEFVHTAYAGLDPNNLPPGYNLVELPVSPTNNGLEHYYMITYPGLPLLHPLRAVPVLGNPLANLVEPNLTYLVNLGYGDPHYGYSTDYADVPTPFGLFPSINPITFAGDMLSGTQQGVNAFGRDLSAMAPTSPPSPSLPDLSQTGGLPIPWTLPSTPAPTGLSLVSFIGALKAANTNIANTISDAAATGYAVALPTADIANSLLTSVPSYGVNLFLDGIAQAATGDPIGLVNAIGHPIAAGAALVTIAGGFEFLVLFNAAESIAQLG
ncbi:PE-PPE domain-containing protein [Mycobacterium shinjukuense]|uniref:PE-PPE domain-containing protein n=1 Tax=Mycobacterium shinjukuense TaxID=398694 RepID=UPI0009F725E1|nr:PE-PPE domain-containing protein [Mycobacterium shinjukuense]ORB70663.1 PE family protein [Mycobacterium shinjukuense]